MVRIEFTLFRSLTSLIFIYAGIKHLTHPEGILKRVASSRVYGILNHEGLFNAAVHFSGWVMVIAGISMFLGYRSRHAAWLLLAMLIPITLSTQLENLSDLGPFFKNVAITGSLLLIIKTRKHENKENIADSDSNAHQSTVILAKQRAER